MSTPYELSEQSVLPPDTTQCAHHDAGGILSPRMPWLAGLMSIMMPGFGQLYLGQVNRALWYFLLFSVAAIPLLTIAALYVPGWAMLGMLLLGTAVALGVWLTSIVDAYVSARASNGYQLRPWQTSSMYFAVFLICSLVLLLALHHVRNNQVQAFRIPSNSMSPTLLPGDYLFADMRYNCPGCRSEVRQGDLAIFVYPNNRNTLYIKRVSGLPGDKVVVQGDIVRVDGKRVPEYGAETAGALSDGAGGSGEANKPDMTESADQVSSPTVEPVELTVPPGQVFVLGDNRAGSSDSRDYGTVPMADIVGKARQLWFSRGKHGIRWGRIGRRVDQP